MSKQILFAVLLSLVSSAPPERASYELDVNHSQLIVQWGDVDKSTFILAIGEDDKPSKLFKSNQPSKFTEIPFSWPDEAIPNAADQLFLNGTRALVIDSKSKVLCSIWDHTATDSKLTCSELTFSPSKILFHPTIVDVLVALDVSSAQLYYSDSYGMSWRNLMSGVRKVFWGSWDDKTSIFVLVDRSAGKLDVLKSFDFFQRSEILVDSNVADLDVSGDFVFITKNTAITDHSESGLLTSGKRNMVNLFIRYKDTDSVLVTFGLEMADRTPIEYHIADASEGQVFLVVSSHKNGSPSGPYRHDLYISNSRGSSFTLSLSNISYYSPKLQNRNLLRRNPSTEKMADLYSVKSLRGVFIATQVVEGDVNTDLLKLTFQTLITYNKGASWHPITVPETSQELSNHKLPKGACVNEECRVQLVQDFILTSPRVHLSPIFSSHSAPGFVLATGIIAESLPFYNITASSASLSGSDQLSDIAFFMSEDGGISFHKAMKGAWKYRLLDSGGLIVLVEPFSATSSLWFSYNNGNSWELFQFSDEPIFIQDAVSKPGDKSPEITLFGTSGTGNDQQNWIVVTVDFSSVFERTCGTSDYQDDWKIGSDEFEETFCILGMEDSFKRRKTNSRCLNGLSFDPFVETRKCMCTRDDYECDHGTRLIEETGECQWVSQKTSKPESSQCSEDDSAVFYSSRGYLRVAGDECVPGNEARAQFEPIHRTCPSEPGVEFIIVATGSKIHRRSFTENEDSDTLIDVGGDFEGTVFDYGYGVNTLFYLEKPYQMTTFIKALNLSSMEAPATIHEVSRGQIMDMSVDFLSGHLYWIEGADEYGHEYRIVMSDLQGRNKRTVVDHASGFLQSPKALRVDPVHGYLFWIVWGGVSDTGPAIVRSTSFGSNPQIIVDSNIHWAKSLQIDFFDSEGMIYWVDLFYSRVERCRYDGSGRETVLPLDTHFVPQSFTIFKDHVYVALQNNSTVLRASKSDGSDRSKAFDLPGESPLTMQAFFKDKFTGESTCNENNGGCSHICVPISPIENVCICPDEFEAATDAANAPSEVCSCPTGETMQEDGTCTAAMIRGTCSEGYFQCNSTKECIPERWRCDAGADCPDSSDEVGCNYEECSDYEFQCEITKLCIPKMWQCDFDLDCGRVFNVEDKSDEKNCTYPPCTDSQFRCDMGKCIMQSWRCDHDLDCPDHSDERACTIQLDDTAGSTSCPSGTFQCADRSQCIPQQWHCDNQQDCPDNSDETGCHAKCNPIFQFDCESTTGAEDAECVYTQYLCDGNSDCSNARDEDSHLCATPAPGNPPTRDPGSPCEEDERACPGSEHLCIRTMWFCDRVPDCPDGTDESNCEYDSNSTQCLDFEWRCLSGDQCVMAAWRCDGSPDCNDASDEHNCHPGEDTAGCTADQFACTDGASTQCLPVLSVCDGYLDCPDGSDEKDCREIPDSSPVASVCNVAHGELCPSDACFRCLSADQKCLPLSKKCNGPNDCQDGSDEMNCGGSGSTGSTCLGADFACGASSVCISADNVCNNFHDCPEREDEEAELCGPSNVRQVELAIVEPRKIHLKWAQPDDNGPVSSFVVTWRRMLGEKTSEEETRKVDKSVNNFIINSLTPNTPYIVTVSSVLANSAPLPARWRQIVTTPEDVASPPRDLTVHSLVGSNSHAQASWRVPSFPNGHITGYRLYFRNQALGEEAPAQSVTTIDTQFTVRDLDADESYEFWVVAVNGAGEGKRSNVVTYSHSDAFGAHQSPGNFRLMRSDRSTVSFNWDPLDQAGVKYEVLVVAENDPTREGQRLIKLEDTQFTAAGDISYTVTNLSPGEPYYVQVRGVSGNVIGPYSEPIRFTVPGSTLPSPSGLTCVPGTDPKYRSLQLAWETPSYSDYIFGIYYGRTEQELISLGNRTLTPSGVNQFTLGDLMSGVTYFVAVRIMQDSRGSRLVGPLSHIRTCETAVDPQLPPRAVHCVPSDDSFNVQLSWRAPREVIAKDYTYTVSYWADLSESLEKNVPVTNATELSTKIDVYPGLTYQFTVGAHCVESNVDTKVSEIATCTIPRHGAPSSVYARIDGEKVLVVWNQPKNLQPTSDLGYDVYGFESSDDIRGDDLSEFIVGSSLTETFKFVPRGPKLFSVALKPYELPNGAMGSRGALSSPVAPIPEPGIDSLTGGVEKQTFSQLVHNVTVMEIMIPAALAIVFLVMVTTFLMYKKRQLERLVQQVGYSRDNGVSFTSGNPDYGGNAETGSAVPYGRLDDYDDELMNHDALRLNVDA